MGKLETLEETARQYRQALLDQEQIEKDLKEVKAVVADLARKLGDGMADAEQPDIYVDGLLYSIARKVSFSKKSCDEEALYDQLERSGLGGIIRRTVNANTFGATMKELAARHAEELGQGGDYVLPEEWEPFVSVYDRVEVGKPKIPTEAKRRALEAARKKEG